MAPQELQADTFPKLLMHQARTRGDRPAVREKSRGIWQTLTWRDLADETVALAAGLAERGLQRGGHVALIGDNRPRLYAALCATQWLGAVAVPLYQDASAAELLDPMRNAEITHIFAEDQEQVDKLLEILPQLPAVTTIIYDQDRGMRHYRQPQLVSHADLLTQGRALLAARRDALDAEAALGRGSDPAALFFTAGTTGQAKAVVLSHGALINRARTAAAMENLRDTDVTMAYLPPAWIGQHMFGYAQPMVVGFCVCCPESPETMLADMREIGPTYFVAPPKVLESLLAQVSVRMEDAGRIKRSLYQYFMALARRVGVPLLSGQAVPLGDRLVYRLGDMLMYGPLRDVLGMSRVRLAYTAGEAIGPDLLLYFRALGVNLKQLYGATETGIFVCVQPDGEVKPDSVGTATDGVELKFTAQRELLVRSPGLFSGYHGDADATRLAIDADGWFHTGDAGWLGDDGQLRIIDRVQDVGALADGSLFAPKYLENKLKFFPFVKEAVAIGAGRDEVCMVVSIDAGAVGNWADRHNIAYSGYADLASRDEVQVLIADCVGKMNAELAQDPALASLQVHRFLLLHKELEADDGELTRTGKLRRVVIGERYQALVDALYARRDSVRIDAQVRYEDGRQGTISADLKICRAPTFAAAPLPMPTRKAA